VPRFEHFRQRWADKFHMGSAKPLAARVAVLMPFYGRPDDLHKSLRSLTKEKTLHDVIVVDDGNADRVTIPRGLHDRVIVLRHETNAGITEARNTGLRYALEAGYEYVANLDAGDRLLNGALAKQLAFLDGASDCALVGGHALFVDERGKTLYRFAPPCDSAGILRMLHRRMCFLHSTVMLRAEVVRSVGFYREEYPAAEDYDFFFRIAERFPTANLPEILLEYEVSPHSISSLRRRTQVVSKLRIIVAHFEPGLLESWRGVAEAAVGATLPRSVNTLFHTLHARLTGSATQAVPRPVDNSERG
jgi:glycosyltransferase involved in cell wall biosynthesis